jgi:hypothetical protein
VLIAPALVIKVFLIVQTDEDSEEPYTAVPIYIYDETKSNLTKELAAPDIP